jgi:hypothetical protein
MATVPDLKVLENQDRLYFQVLINYIDSNDGGGSVVNTELETAAFGTMKEASGVAKKITDKFLSTVPDANLVELKPDQQTDEYHIFVVDVTNNVVVAKIGIVATDYTNVTLH